MRVVNEIRVVEDKPIYFRDMRVGQVGIIDITPIRQYQSMTVIKVESDKVYSPNNQACWSNLTCVDITVKLVEAELVIKKYL